MADLTANKRKPEHLLDRIARESRREFSVWWGALISTIKDVWRFVLSTIALIDYFIFGFIVAFLGMFVRAFNGAVELLVAASERVIKDLSTLREWVIFQVAKRKSKPEAPTEQPVVIKEEKPNQFIPTNGYASAVAASATALVKDEPKAETVATENTQSKVPQPIADFLSFIGEVFLVFYDFADSLIEVITNGIGQLLLWLREALSWLFALAASVVTALVGLVSSKERQPLAEPTDVKQTAPLVHESFAIRNVPQPVKWMALGSTLFMIVVLTMLVQWGTSQVTIVQPVRNFLGLLVLIIALLKVVNWDAYTKAFRHLNQWALNNKWYLYLVPIFELAAAFMLLSGVRLLETLLLLLILTLLSVAGMRFLHPSVRAAASDDLYFHYFSWRDFFRIENLLLTLLSVALLLAVVA